MSNTWQLSNGSLITFLDDVCTEALKSATAESFMEVAQSLVETHGVSEAHVAEYLSSLYGAMKSEYGD